MQIMKKEQEQDELALAISKEILRHITATKEAVIDLVLKDYPVGLSDEVQSLTMDDISLYLDGEGFL
jgi:hypothetical protein